MAGVEEVLAAARRLFPNPRQQAEDRPVVSHALWICACVCLDDAPTWLIYDTPDDGVAWCRVPDAVEPLDLVIARQSSGGHADPSDVLRWLRGDASDPWTNHGDSDGDADVVTVLGRRLRG